MMPIDKALHFMVGLVIAAGAFWLTDSAVFAVAAAVAAALGKEVRDYLRPGRNVADPWDAFSTALGGVVFWLTLQPF